MQLSQKKAWKVADLIPEEIAQALSDYPPFLRQVLYNRGVHTLAQAQAFLDGQVEEHDPFGMVGMLETVDRLQWAINHQEPIVVYGDYDADGVTSTALMVQVLRRLGARVEPYIPSRFDEGYGLNLDAIDLLKQNGVQVILTVDCGIRSFKEAERANELGLDLLICDHHHPLQGVPAAYAVICPRQDHDTYPDKDLAGVGLAYKLARALITCYPNAGLDAEEWLDLVAIGTVADVAPLTGENRSLVRRGLQVIRQGRRPGIASLVGVSRLNINAVSAYDLGFAIGPRLNAAGRIGSAMDSLNLLMAEDKESAGILAQHLDDHNYKRQQMMREMQEQAERLAAESGYEDILFAFDEQFSEGILGLAASRLVDRYYRPVVVGKIEGDLVRASCRSIPEFHITSALDECKELMERHGGHAMAAGLTIRTENIPLFIEQMTQIARRELDHKELSPVLFADKELKLSEVKGKYINSLLNYLEKLQPTGQSNPEVVFISYDVTVKNYSLVGSDKSHLRLVVADEEVAYPAIAFRQGHWSRQMPGRIDLMYQITIDRYNGQPSVQLKVLDLRPAQPKVQPGL